MTDSPGVTLFFQALFTVQGRILARSCCLLFDAPGHCSTDARNLPTPILGDGATPFRPCSPGSGAVSPKRSEACGDYARTCDAMREGPPWIAASCATARASLFVLGAPHSSVNVNHSLKSIPRYPEPASGRLFRCASCEPPP